MDQSTRLVCQVRPGQGYNRWVRCSNSDYVLYYFQLIGLALEWSMNPTAIIMGFWYTVVAIILLQKY